MAKDCMLTTTDNPYNPFDEFTRWLMYDKEFGYNTCERIGRIVDLRSDMTQKEEDEEIERAIDLIVLNDPIGLYTKIWPNQGPNK